MNQEAVFHHALLPSGGAKPPAFMRKFMLYCASALLVLAVVMAAWLVRRNAPFQPHDGLGYTLGLTGGLLMLGLLLYPLRKRVRMMREWGALKHWFRFHMIGGVLGPMLVLFHSTFRVGSVNAGVALTCMLLVVASGLIGRFLYRKIHHGLYGSQASLRDLEQALGQQLDALDPILCHMPQVKKEVEQFAALVSCAPGTWLARTSHFLFLGIRRVLTTRRLRRMLAEQSTSGVGRLATSPFNVSPLLETINSTLQAAQRRAQFSTFERLFSLWHVIHTPFLCMLLITAIVHVVAVHSY